uniref:RdRp n=1 Tax=Hubei partiti-like virus 9 TaxID=1923072 RepID=A0A1L3KLM0_9VIRU|nr:RdRp [Hubei partiti-like virus 9]
MIELKPLEGFPQDLRNPGLDDVAYDYAAHWFGYGTVDGIRLKLHRSHITFEKLEEDLMGFNRQFRNNDVRADPVYQYALQTLRDDYLPAEKLIAGTLGFAEKHPELPKDRSPGLPWKLKGYKTKRDCLNDPEARRIWHTKWDRIGRGKDETLPDAALFLRAQIADVGTDKIRSVWGYPIDVIVEEGRWFYPFIKWVRDGENTIPIAYRAEMANGGMAYLNDMLNCFHDSSYIVGDWSKFDKTIPPWLIRDCFQIVMDAFDHSKVVDSEGLVWNVNPARSIRRFKRIVRYFINTPVRMCTGRRFMKLGGVPSGSMWTNLIDSMVNTLVWRYLTYHTLGQFPQAELYLGDDSVVVGPGPVNLDDIAALAFQAFGMVLNVRKSYVTTNPKNVHFLGYYNHDGRPYKAQDFLIASFIYPERNVDDNIVRVSRAVGQMWSTLNGGAAVSWHNLVSHMMTDFGYSADEINQHIRSKPGFFKYLRILGIDLSQVTLPERSYCWQPFIERVEAFPVPLKPYRRRKRWKQFQNPGSSDVFWKSCVQTIMFKTVF